MIRVAVVYGLVLLFGVAVAGKILKLQFIDKGEIQSEVQQQIYDNKVIPAPLGNIYADSQNQRIALIQSVPRYTLHADVMTVDSEVFFAKVDSLAYHLSKVFRGRSKQQWKSDLLLQRDKGNRFYRIARKVKYDELEKVRSFPIFRKGRYKGGLIVQEQNVRVRPYGMLAKKTIGKYKELDNHTVSYGLEAGYKEYLRGVEGYKLMKRIGANQWKPIDSEINVEPRNGYDLYTSLDVNIQDVAEAALLKQLENQRAQSGCAILMEVKTGYVKAVANLKRGTDGKYYENIDVANMATEPGSTFKLASLITLLEDQKLRVTDSVEMPGEYLFYDQRLRDSRPEGYGKNTVQYAFEVSSNVFSKLVFDAYQGEEQMFVDGLRKLGIDQPMGIDAELGQEGSPMIKNADHKEFSGISTAWMAIGYESKMTPLQTLALYNAVANNGCAMRPKLVKEIRNGVEIVERFDPEVMNPQICSKETIGIVRECLEGVVHRGTARNIRARGFKIAGKTGTAKIASSKGYTSKYQASFCGYFPADEPKYSCIVVVSGPTKNIYGAVVSGTVFKEIADKVYSADLEVSKKRKIDKQLAAKQPASKNGSAKDLITVLNHFGVQTNQSGKLDWVATTAQKNAVQMRERRIAKQTVPNVLGMGLSDALYLLETAGLTVRVTGSGTVRKQSLAKGVKINRGSQIDLELM